MILDILFNVWRRLRGPVQWWTVWLFSSKFMVSVAGVIFDAQGKILLQRHRHWVPDVWGLPGGIVQRGESLEHALAREVMEETGLAIGEIELLLVNSGFNLRLEGYFSARLTGDPAAQNMKLQKQEVLEARFYAPEDLPANLLPVHREAILRARQPQRIASENAAC